MITTLDVITNVKYIIQWPSYNEEDHIHIKEYNQFNYQ